jgi:hypothetical protein
MVVVIGYTKNIDFLNSKPTVPNLLVAKKMAIGPVHVKGIQCGN